MKNNTLLIGAALLAAILFLPKKIIALKDFQLQDYFLDGSGNYIVMVSGTEYKKGSKVGTIVKDELSEQFNDVVIRSSDNKKIYHVVNKATAKSIFKDFK